MRHLNKRRMVWPVGVVFALAGLFWILYFPFRPAQVLRVVPPDAVAASWHWRPSDRLPAWLRSAPVALALALADMTPERAHAALDAPGTRTLIRRLGGTGMALAYAPAFGRHGNPALVLGAWIGGPMTHLMRIGLLDRAFEGFEVHRVGSDRLWIAHFPDFPPAWRYLSFGVYEGVLAGCASSDPLGALPLLAALRRHGPLAELTAPWTDRKGHMRLREPDSPSPDRMRWHARLPSVPPVTVEGFLRVSEDGALTVSLQAPSPWPFRESDAVDTDVANPLALRWPVSHSIPAIRMAMPVETARHAAQAFLPPAWVERIPMASLVSLASPGATMVGWISVGDHGGRIMRMKVPAVGLAFQSPETIRVGSAAGAVTDMLNAMPGVGVGLIPVMDRQIPHMMALRPVNSTGIWRLMGEHEVPAMAMTNGWLMVMTHAGALRRLLSTSNDGPAWQPSEDLCAEETRVYAGMRLPEVGRAASNVLAAYALVRLMQTGKAERLDTPPVRRVLDALDRMGTLTVCAGNTTAGHQRRLVVRMDGVRAPSP